MRTYVARAPGAFEGDGTGGNDGLWRGNQDVPLKIRDVQRPRAVQVLAREPSRVAEVLAQLMGGKCFPLGPQGISCRRFPEQRAVPVLVGATSLEREQRRVHDA